MPRGQRHELTAPAHKERIGGNEQRGDALLDETCERRIELALGPDLHQMGRLPERARRLLRSRAVGLGVRVVRIEQQADLGRRRHHGAQQFHTLGRQHVK